jgi:hypothetical protein
MTKLDGTPEWDVITTAWQAFAARTGDGRRVRGGDELSAHVSTNRVYLVSLDDGSAVVAKCSSYGSYFLFAEDHDRLARCVTHLRGTRWDGFLAEVLTHEGCPYTWYDGQRWVVFYSVIERAEKLPAILEPTDIAGLGREIASFHRACADVAPSLPPVSNSVKGDAIHLYDQLSGPFAPRNFDLAPEQIGVLARATHDLLLHLERVHYDEWERLPILVDWNLGNFSVTRTDATVRLFSRWDYDWFRIETRLLDFYFLSRVSSRTGDKTSFTYSPHTLVEPRFAEFIRAYHEVWPLTRDDVEFLPHAYTFFILNYVVREGARFFRHDLCTSFRRDAARHWLHAARELDLKPLYDAIGLSRVV